MAGNFDREDKNTTTAVAAFVVYEALALQECCDT